MTNSRMNTVKFLAIGPALRVTAYVIDQSILTTLLKASDGDAVYENNRISLVTNIALRSEVLTHGFSLSQADEVKFSLAVNDREVMLSAVGYLEDGFEFEEVFDCQRHEALIAHLRLLQQPREHYMINDDEMLVIEVEDIKVGRMYCEFQTLEEARVELMSLGLADLDSDTDLFIGPWQTGLFFGREHDIRYLQIGEEKHELEFEVDSGYASSFYLVKRENGLWAKDWLE